MKIPASIMTFIAEVERLETEQTGPDLYTNFDLRDINLWECWRGVEAIELGYSQSLIAQFRRDRTIAGRVGRQFSS